MDTRTRRRRTPPKPVPYGVSVYSAATAGDSPERSSPKAVPWAERGFTIVELLVVIVVIAILAAITVVAYNGIQQRARDSQRASDVQAIAKALELYYADNGQYPDGQCAASCSINGTWSSTADGSWQNLQAKLVPRYISKLPEDPVNTQGSVSLFDSNAYNYSYTASGYYCGGSGTNQMFILVYRLEVSGVHNQLLGDCSVNPLPPYGSGSSNYRVNK